MPIHQLKVKKLKNSNLTFILRTTLTWLVGYKESSDSQSPHTKHSSIVLLKSTFFIHHDNRSISPVSLARSLEVEFYLHCVVYELCSHIFPVDRTGYTKACIVHWHLVISEHNCEDLIHCKFVMCHCTLS